MYASDSIFNRYLNFNNNLGPYLMQKDFFVTTNSHSQYNHTAPSLSSTLNLEPLSYQSDSSLAEYKKVLIAIKEIESSVLINSFKNAGYTINNYSVFKIDKKNSPLYFNLESYILKNYTASTLFNRIYNNFDPDGFVPEKRVPFLNFIKSSWSDDVKRDNVFLYKSFQTILSQQQPSFNYFHFQIPHPPFVYDSLGNPVSLKDMYDVSDYKKRIERYVSYTKYANQLIIKMIDAIFKKFKGNAVIILQGDHGYREFTDRLPAEVSYGILNSVYLPNKNYKDFNDTMTPINTFNQVLKNQFAITIK
jgi:hypothetical protein